MARPVATRELSDLLGALTQPAALTELAVLAACMAAAWGLVRLWRGRQAPEGSIWFGKHLVDGVLFPLLALSFAYGAKLSLSGSLQPAVFRIAIPILLSLAIIRLSVRVLGATLPRARWVRAIEKSISWLAWGGVILWVTGVLPSMLEAMEEIGWKIGGARVSLRNVIDRKSVV